MFHVFNLFDVNIEKDGITSEKKYFVFSAFIFSFLHEIRNKKIPHLAIPFLFGDAKNKISLPWPYQSVPKVNFLMNTIHNGVSPPLA